jgi:anaerobic ribonucleoside-triphosphate reductase
MSDVNLKDCPFCGFHHHGVSDDKVWCPNCGAEGPTDCGAFGIAWGTERDYEDLWNRRASEEVASE